MAVQRGQISWVQGSKTFPNPIAVKSAQLKRQDDRAHLQAGRRGALHRKDSGEPARTGVGRQGDHEDGGQWGCRIGLDYNRRSPTGLFAGRATRKLDPVDIATPQVHSPFSKFVRASSLRESQAVSSWCRARASSRSI